MSTYDVPGANPANNDELRMGCWAEHDDGSLIFVYSTEGNRVIYTMFDLAKDPIVEYRDSMRQDAFEKTFTWDPTKKAKKGAEKWLWHDKTPFPWDRIIKDGGQDGIKFASASALKTAAERVAESLRLRAETVKDGAYNHMVKRSFDKTRSLVAGFGRMLAKLDSKERQDIIDNDE